MLERRFLDKMNDINLFKTFDSVFLKKITSKDQLKKDDSCDGYLLSTSENEARRIIDSLKGSKKVIALIGKDDSFNRRAIETLRIKYLVSPEAECLKDTLKQRDSGLNHVVAKEAVRKGIEIVFDLSRLKKVFGKEKSAVLSSMIQNVKICRKAKCLIKIASFGKDSSEVVDEKSRRAFGVSLGMSSVQAAESVKF